jgi:hypothetical protein
VLVIGPDANADLLDRDAVCPALAEIGDDGAILVRPDGHVAWRTAALPADPAAALAEALDVVLGRRGNGSPA